MATPPAHIADDENYSRVLPEDYTPGENTVVIGRGKKIKTRKGNLKLLDIVRDELPTYSVAGCKAKKSKILVRIVERVKDTCPDLIGFVKHDSTTGRWTEVSMLAARTTVAQAFRDTNHVHYRSSKQSKQRRRKEKKQVPSGRGGEGGGGGATSGCGGIDDTPITLRHAYHEHMASAAMMRSRARVLAHNSSNSSCGGPFLHQESSFRSMMHHFPGRASGIMASPPMHYSPQQSRQRLVNILDSAVNCSEFGMEDDELAFTSPAAISSASSCDDEEDPFEPVPISLAFDDSSSSEEEEDEEEEEEDVFNVFDELSAADIRAALTA